MILASTIFETGVKIATKIRREKNKNCVEFSFHSISGLMGVEELLFRVPKIMNKFISIKGLLFIVDRSHLVGF